MQKENFRYRLGLYWWGTRHCNVSGGSVIALVTGAARGIGQAIARKLAAQGATVISLDRDRNWPAESE